MLEPQFPDPEYKPLSECSLFALRWCAEREIYASEPGVDDHTDMGFIRMYAQRLLRERGYY